jgi:hypothetical protein
VGTNSSSGPFWGSTRLAEDWRIQVEVSNRRSVPIDERPIVLQTIAFAEGGDLWLVARAARIRCRNPQRPNAKRVPETCFFKRVVREPALEVLSDQFGFLKPAKNVSCSRAFVIDLSELLVPIGRGSRSDGQGSAIIVHVLFPARYLPCISSRVKRIEKWGKRLVSHPGSVSGADERRGLPAFRDTR